MLVVDVCEIGTLIMACGLKFARLGDDLVPGRKELLFVFDVRPERAVDEVYLNDGIRLWRTGSTGDPCFLTSSF